MEPREGGAKPGIADFCPACKPANLPGTSEETDTISPRGSDQKTTTPAADVLRHSWTDTLSKGRILLALISSFCPVLSSKTWTWGTRIFLEPGNPHSIPSTSKLQTSQTEMKRRLQGSRGAGYQLASTAMGSSQRRWQRFNHQGDFLNSSDSCLQIILSSCFQRALQKARWPGWV